MVTVRESEVDGVPCFWVETGRPTLAASLVFRQGMADEPLHESGWLHLLEHMCLHGAGGGSLQINGSVSPLLTTFDAHGPAESVAAHLTRVAAWLGNPTLHDVERERRVLRAESTMRGGSLVSSFRERYGAQGPGVASYGEPGLSRVTREALWDRSRAVFNSGNAVLVLDGPPPRHLHLSLAPGSYLPPARAESVESRFRTAYVDPSGLVISGTAERSHASGIAASLLQKALRQEIRERAGAGYAPWSTYEPVDADTAVLAAGSDLRPDVLPVVAEKALLALQRLREGAPSGWLEEEIAARVQALRDPYNARGLAMNAALAVLNDRLPQSLDELVAEAEQTDREQVRAVFDQMHATLLLGAPARTRLPRHFEELTFPRSEPWRGARGARHVNWPADRRRFAVSHAGISIVRRGDAWKIAADDVAGLLTYADGTRVAIGRDGWFLAMGQREWRGGARLARAMDALVPPQLHLPAEGESGHERFRRLPWRRRWVRTVRRAAWSAPGLALLAVVFATVAVVAASRQAALVSGVALIVAFVSLLLVPSAYLRGRRRLW